MFEAGEVIFVETETDTETITEAVIVESGFSSEPFFIGMKVGGVALIISLGIAVIIKIFRTALS